MPKKRGLGQFADLRGGGGLGKKDEWRGGRGGDTPNAHYYSGGLRIMKYCRPPWLADEVNFSF